MICQINYSPFGEAILDFMNPSASNFINLPIGYNSQIQDSETGIIFIKQKLNNFLKSSTRPLDSFIGRFMSFNPLQLEDFNLLKPELSADVLRFENPASKFYTPNPFGKIDFFIKKMNFFKFCNKRLCFNLLIIQNIL